MNEDFKTEVDGLLDDLKRYNRPSYGELTAVALAGFFLGFVSALLVMAVCQ